MIGYNVKDIKLMLVWHVEALEKIFGIKSN